MFKWAFYTSSISYERRKWLGSELYHIQIYSNNSNLIHSIFKCFRSDCYPSDSGMIYFMSDWFRPDLNHIQTVQIITTSYPSDSCTIHFMFICFKFDSLWTCPWTTWSFFRPPSSLVVFCLHNKNQNLYWSWSLARPLPSHINDHVVYGRPLYIQVFHAWFAPYPSD